MSSAGSPGYDHLGRSDASGLRTAILVARFNSDVTERLLDGARRALLGHGAVEEDLSIVAVPGAWELPQAAARAVASGDYDAIIALGCVVRGDTPHFEYVCSNASLGLGAVARDASVPVVFGVLTTDDQAQALARAGDGPDNKGYEAALTAVEMVSVLRGFAAGRGLEAGR